MKRQEKADRIHQILEGLYPQTPVPLDHDDPFTLLLAVLLSAQCTDKRVNQITPILFAAASTPSAMIELGVERIREIIKPCGLSPAKSKNIHALSQKILAEHKGCVPRTFAELEDLPGVGHKSASVVMAQAFGVSAFPVDTHIHRLAGRWGLSKARNVGESERDLKKLFPRDSWNRLHLQIIFFGREHCPARRHDFAVCPICQWAASKERIRQEQQKNTRSKKAAKSR